MGSGFSLGTDVLLFPFRWPRGAKQRQSLLWPALVYRVVAPLPRRRRCNLLERAVLSLCRAGLRRAEEIAPRLHIEKDLAAHIARDLMERRCLSGDGALTVAGETLWQEELEDATDQQVCHVFQDLQTGRLWPSLAEMLPFAERRMNDQGYPVVIKGSSGNPWKEQPFVVLPPQHLSLPEPPSAAEILAVSRRHGRRRRRDEDDEEPEDSRGADEAGEGEDEPGPRSAETRDARALERIAMIEADGRPVLLLTFAHVREGGDADEEGLQVCDPFTGQPSLWLGEQVRARSKQLRPLGDRLARLLTRGEEGRRADAQRVHAAQKREAEAQVEEHLGSAVHHSALYGLIVAMAQAAREQELLDEAPDFKRAAPLIALRAALEQGVHNLSRDLPLGNVYQVVFQGPQPHPDVAFIRALYEGAAQQVGFTVPLPSALSQVDPEQLRAACGADGAWRLRPRLMATMLRAAGAAQHPLRFAAQREPRFLAQLNDLFRLCSAAIHGKPPRPRDLRETLKCGWVALKILIDIGA